MTDELKLKDLKKGNFVLETANPFGIRVDKPEARDREKHFVSQREYGLFSYEKIRIAKVSANRKACSNVSRLWRERVE